MHRNLNSNSETELMPEPAAWAAYHNRDSELRSNSKHQKNLTVLRKAPGAEVLSQEGQGRQDQRR